MVDYVIINSTAVELTNVNVGGTDVAAYTISGNVTLTDAELATVASLNGVAVMQASASAAEKAAVGNLIVQGSGAVPPTDLTVGTSYKIANGSGAALTNVNAAGDDVPAGTTLTATLTPAEAKILSGTAGVVLFPASSTDAEKAYAAKVLELGSDPTVKTA